MKKLLIALMSTNAVLVALLTAQASQANTAKVKTYDAVKLAEYTACLNSIVFSEEGRRQFSPGGDGTFLCRLYKP